ncbi:pilus assembly protein HicB [Nocardioides kribbensis]|uniref:pilus assembly protein HicB n=1 Tax=Nocardioides kribbensis TaxID=305517 RepID=UPI00187A25E8|nr:pilus assembly protein HicB [Nocardioides kribbensis]
MDLTPYVDSLRRDLLAAADASGEEARALAQRLGHALDPAARLALMEAISHAAAQITAEMPVGGVDVRLDGRELAFVVDATPPAPLLPPAPPASPAPPAPPSEELDDAAVSRVTLRLPEPVKARAEELAAEAGQSLNTWLVHAVRRATQQPSEPLDLTSTAHPGAQPGPGGGPVFTRRPGSRRLTGWV